MHEVSILDGIFTHRSSSHVPQESVAILQSVLCLSPLTPRLQQLHDQIMVAKFSIFCLPLVDMRLCPLQALIELTSF